MFCWRINNINSIGAIVTVTISGQDQITATIESNPYTAVSKDAAGNDVTDTYTWTEEDGTGSATISGSQLTGVVAGMVTITATSNGNPSIFDSKQVEVLDGSAPYGSIAINEDADATSSTSVTLTLSAMDPESGISQMRFRNDDSDLSECEWEDYNTSKNWTISSTEGTRTVYAQFKNGVGLTGDVVSDSIILDTISPVLTIISPTDSVTITVISELGFKCEYSDAASGIVTETFAAFLNGINITAIFTISPTLAEYLPITNTQQDYDIAMQVYYLLVHGVNELKFNISDNAGLTTEQITYFNVTLDTIVPPSPPPKPITMEIAYESALNQEGMVGFPAPIPLLVKVYNPDDEEPYEGIPLLFEIEEGYTGFFTPATKGHEGEFYSTVTDEDGYAGVQYNFSLAEDDNLNKVKVSILGNSNVIYQEFNLVGYLPRVRIGSDETTVLLRDANNSGIEVSIKNVSNLASSNGSVRTITDANAGTAVLDIEIRQTIGTVYGGVFTPNSAIADMVPPFLVTNISNNYFYLVAKTSTGNTFREIKLPEFPKFVPVVWDIGTETWGITSTAESYWQAVTINSVDGNGFDPAIVSGNAQIGMPSYQLENQLSVNVADQIQDSIDSFQLPQGYIGYAYNNKSVVCFSATGCVISENGTNWDSYLEVETVSSEAAIYAKPDGVNFPRVDVAQVKSEIRYWDEDPGYITTTNSSNVNQQFIIAPPVMQSVRLEETTYVPCDYLELSNVFNVGWEVITQPDTSKYFYIEWKGSTNGPTTISVTLTALNGFGYPLESPYGAVALTSTEITLTKQGYSDLYRSEPVQITQEISSDPESLDPLPTNREITYGEPGLYTEITDTYGSKIRRLNSGIQFVNMGGGQMNYLPAFIPDDGVGRGLNLHRQGPSFAVILPGADGVCSLSDMTIDVITATYQVTPDSPVYEATLTETSNTSLIFANGDNSFKVQILSSTTTDPDTRENIIIELNISALKLKDRNYKLYEVAVDSLDFTRLTIEMETTFSSPLNSGAIDIITATIKTNLDSSILNEETLTETDIATNIFQNSENSITIDMSINPPLFNSEVEERVTISLSISDTYVTDESICLIEIGSDALTYSNNSRALTGNLAQLTPYQQIFYLRKFAPDETASSIYATLTSTAQTINNLSLDKIAKGVYQSDCILAAPPSVTSLPSYSGVTNLQKFSALQGTVQASASPLITGDVVYDAFCAMYFHEEDEYDNFTKLVGIRRRIKFLGYSVLSDYDVTWSEMSDGLQDKSICYMLSHGVCGDIDKPSQYFIGPEVQKSGKAFQPADLWGSGIYDNFTLVFFNGCQSGDSHKKPGAEETNAQDFAERMGVTKVMGYDKQDNPIKQGAYMGWTICPTPIYAKDFALKFFEFLRCKGYDVSSARTQAIAEFFDYNSYDSAIGSKYNNKGNKWYLITDSNITFIGNASIVINRSN